MVENMSRRFVLGSLWVSCCILKTWINCVILPAYLSALTCPHTGEAASGDAAKFRSITAQSGIRRVHPHLHGVMQRSHVAGDAVLSFHRNCHLRSHTGSGHIGSQLWCHLTSLLLCKCHQSESVGKGACVSVYETVIVQKNDTPTLFDL